MTYDLQDFALADMLRCGLEIRKSAGGNTTAESTASAVVRYLYETMRSTEGRPACALVRFYMTNSFGSLPRDRQRFAENIAGVVPSLRTKCLTLMATAGEQPEWNDRAKSRGHQAIPLQSVQFVQRAPMIAALLDSLGVEIQTLLGSSADLVTKLEGKTFNVFHVEDAKGSPHIPAQEEFVVPYGIRSVIGFGGVLTSGELFAVIMFTRVPVARSSADRFRNIALDVKALLHGVGEARVFG